MKKPLPQVTAILAEISILSHGTDTEKSFAIQGRVTVDNSDQMRRALVTALRDKPPSIAVDLSGVSYIDSSGLATLIEAARIARNQRTRLVLSGIRDQPRYFFAVTHLDRLFDIREQGATK